MLSSGWDGDGNRTSLDATVGGSTDFDNGYHYDQLNRVNEILQTDVSYATGKKVDFTYTLAGQIHTIVGDTGSPGSYTEAQTSTYSYDRQQRTTEIDYTHSTSTIDDQVYTYYDNGLVETSSSSLTGQTATDGYDGTGQITSVAYTGSGTLPPDESYSYDANGNPAGATLNTSVSAYGNNEVVNDGKFSYVYDPNGNITQKTNLTTGQVMNFTWDFRNRLTQVVITNADSSTTTLTYRYDMYNQLVGRTSTGVTGSSAPADLAMEQWFIYDPAAPGQMVISKTHIDCLGSDAIENRYLWNPDVVDFLLEQDYRISATNGDFWAVNDRLGSVQEMVINPTTLDQVVTDAYGNVLSESDPADDFFWSGGIGFAGSFHDPETGLQLNLNRWYDPAAERWLSQDPANADINTYRYAGNSPTNFTDPSGLIWQWVSDSWSVGTAFVGGLGQGAVNIVKGTVNTVVQGAEMTADTFNCTAEVVTGHSIYKGDLSDAGKALQSGQLTAGQFYADVGANTVTFGVYGEVKTLNQLANGEITVDQASQQIGGTAVFQALGAYGLRGTTVGNLPIQQVPLYVVRNVGRGFVTMVGRNGRMIYRLINPGECLGGAGGLCFVAGTEILVGGSIPDAAPDDQDAQAAADTRGGFDKLAAASIAFVGLVPLVAQRKQRRKRDELATSSDGDGERTSDDDNDSLEPVNGFSGSRGRSTDVADVEIPATRSLRFETLTVAKPDGQFTCTNRRHATGKKGWRAPFVAACLLVAALFAGRAASHRAESEPSVAAPAVTAHSRPSRSIETIRVGQRVLTAASQDANAKPQLHRGRRSQRRKRCLRLRATSLLADGTPDVVEVETLQLPAWIKEHGAQVGALVPPPLDLQEMGLPSNLRARVLADEPCPAIEPGPGRVVLTTVASVSNNVWELSVVDAAGRAQTIRPTGRHKFYSATREGWVAAQELRPGEWLEGIAGRLTLAALRPVPGAQKVYNMTVEEEHVYRVSSLGVLVHNQTCTGALGLTELEPGGTAPGTLYRGGKTNPGNLTPRPSDNGMLSTRDSLSNPWPLKPGQKPPLPAGEPIQVIDTSKLPPGTVVPDGVPYGTQPPGHVSVGPHVPAGTVKGAIVETIPGSATK